jgi:hypothetical protein
MLDERLATNSRVPLNNMKAVVQPAKHSLKRRRWKKIRDDHLRICVNFIESRRDGFPPGRSVATSKSKELVLHFFLLSIDGYVLARGNSVRKTSTSSVSYIKCKANMKSFHQLQMSCLVGQVVLLQQNSNVRVLDSSSSVVKKLCGPERTLDDRV